MVTGRSVTRQVVESAGVGDPRVNDIRAGLLIENADDEQPSCRNHITSIGYHSYRSNIKTGQVPKEKYCGTDHLSQVYEASANDTRES